MPTLIRFSPPRAFIDPNMIDANGLIPAAREYVTGSRRLSGFRVGQTIRAYDEDGNSYMGQIARVEREILFLEIIVREPSWSMERSRYVGVGLDVLEQRGAMQSEAVASGPLRTQISGGVPA